jgi:hypothetical protein
VDVAGVVASALEQVHPQAVELRLHVPAELAGEGPGVARQQLGEFADCGVALRKIVQRRIAGVAGVAMLLRPAASRRVVLREASDRMGESREERVVCDSRFIEVRDEQRPERHSAAVGLLRCRCKAVDSDPASL